MNDEGESLPTVALEKRFKSTMMVGMSVRDDERA